MNSRIAELVVRLPQLHPGQESALSQSKRLNVLACGRRWGKTVLGMDIAIRAMLDGHPVAWAAPHYKYLSEPFRSIRETLGQVIQRTSQEEHRLELATGGTLDCWTLSDTNLGRGRKYKLWVIDEAANAPELATAFSESIRPTLVDLAGGAWFLSTPKGKNYFWECFRRGQDPQESEWASWQMPTASNPHIPQPEIEAARQTMTERQFGQEFLAEFGLDEEAVFRGLEDCLGSRALSGPEQGKQYVAGVDLARLQDYTVVTLFDSQGRQVFLDRFRLVSWERAISRIAETCLRFHAPAVVDATGVGDPIAEQLRCAGVQVLPFSFTSSSKEPLIQSLALKLERQQILLLDDPVQKAEFQGYRATRSKAGRVQFGAPPGSHDDCVTAVALAVSRLDSQPVTVFTPNPNTNLGQPLE